MSESPRLRHPRSPYTGALMNKTDHTLSIAFIGSGAMAEPMMRGFLERHLFAPEAVVASDTRKERVEALHASLGVRPTTDNRAAVRDAQIVVLSVKPQVLRGVLEELRGAIPRGSLVLSIVAGARIESIRAGLKHRAIIRTMPNTPAQVGQGMTVWTVTPEVTPQQQELARTMLQALGKELFVKDESMLDMATAISGSGPAYVFLLMEALIDAAVHLGFSRSDARLLVLQTLRGSTEFADRSASHPAELRNLVTSPGGTSAHALYQLEKGGFRTVLSKAVWAAYQRSVALGTLSPAVRPFDEAPSKDCQEDEEA
jgi:pyrroline-5-carboxylate reductase